MKLVELALALANALAQAGEPGETLARFAQDLRAFRGGDGSVVARLESASHELCARHGRCDAARVLEHYRALAPEARLRGLEHEAHYLTLWERVRAAGEARADASVWERERELVLAELEELARAAEREPDFVPAAQARSLAARILTQQAEAASATSGEQREQLAAAAGELAATACAAFERAGQITPQLEARWLLGRLAARAHDLSAAARRFHDCLALAEAVHNDDFRAHALEGLLGLARAAGDTREQDRRLADLARFRTPESSWPLARDWAARLLHRDLPRSAVELLERCRPPPGAHRLDHIEWQLLAGNALLRAGESEDAREHLERLALDEGFELAVLSLAALALDDGRPEDVCALLQAPEQLAALSPLARERAWALIGEAHHAQGDFESACAALEHAFASAVRYEQLLLDERRDAVAGVAAGVIGERLGLHSIALWADALARRGRPLEAVRVIEDAHARSLRRSAGSGQHAVSSDDVLAAARGCELGLITWVVGADFSVAGHVGPDGSAVCVRIARGRSAIERAARRLREAATSPASDERCALLAAEIAGELVPGQLRERITHLARGTQSWPRLLALAHGAVEGVPLELFDAAALCGREDLALAVRPDLPVRAERNVERRYEWMLCGAPLDRGGGECLPGARAELEALRAVHGDAEFVVGRDFRREVVLGALRGSRALHLATHLVADSRALSAFGSASVLLDDGATLSAEEIARQGPALPLVVLAVCSSGTGEFVDAEGLFGLARAFLASGTESLVVAQWPIEDQSAAEFGLDLHRALSSGASPARAVAMARRTAAQRGFRRGELGAYRAMCAD